MRFGMFVIGVGLALNAAAETTLDCEASEGGLKIELHQTSFRPCVGPCIGAPDRPAVLTTTNQLETGVFEVKTTTEVRPVEADKSSPARVSLSRNSQSTTSINADGTDIPGAVSAYSYYQKRVEFVGYIKSSAVPNESVRASCTRTITASYLKDL